MLINYYEDPVLPTISFALEAWYNIKTKYMTLDSLSSLSLSFFIYATKC